MLYIFLLITDDVSLYQGRIISSVGKKHSSESIYLTPPSSPVISDMDLLSRRMRSQMFLKDSKRNTRSSLDEIRNEPMIHTRIPPIPAPPFDKNKTVSIIFACCDSTANNYVEDEHFKVDSDVIPSYRNKKLRY